MRFHLVVAAFFASVTLADPAVKQLNPLDHPKLVGRPKGDPSHSGGSCCSHDPGVCQPSCCPIGCPKL
ncbi:hypothetical protein CDEST_14194 [Colletotrichum destructivum]|uniref:Uncharacterized protein n=1 Tax=Colletotrichum destructivum TaxID=34406 RepID=A0AAX4J1C4_9PEZI|nr:hypothetical protein CDEST_14194 [Colletotrichum destructivum]